MSEDLRNELITKDSLNTSESSDLSYIREGTLALMSIDHHKSGQLFLGNNPENLKPKKVGEINVFCYCNGNASITIGPHCKKCVVKY